MDKLSGSRQHDFQELVLPQGTGTFIKCYDYTVVIQLEFELMKLSWFQLSYS